MILSTSFMVFAILGTKWIIEMIGFIRPAIMDLVALTIVGIVSYVGSLWVLDKPFILQSRDMVRKSLAV